jgi:hypothetical protein
MESSLNQATRLQLIASQKKSWPFEKCDALADAYANRLRGAP